MVSDIMENSISLRSYQFGPHVRTINLAFAAPRSGREPSLSSTWVGSPLFITSNYNATRALESAEYFGVPNPVTASHPVTAVNPAVPQPWLPPVTMSVKALGFL